MYARTTNGEGKNMAATARKKEKAKPTTKKSEKTPSTEFKVHAPEASEVFLTGDFNGWEANSASYRMRKYKGDIWKKMVPLKPGRYEYRFVVDGCWWTDPENPERACTPYGSENSVITV